MYVYTAAVGSKEYLSTIRQVYAYAAYGWLYIYIYIYILRVLVLTSTSPPYASELDSYQITKQKSQSMPPNRTAYLPGAGGGGMT